jgi:hypothetical protein
VHIDNSTTSRKLLIKKGIIHFEQALSYHENILLLRMFGIIALRIVSSYGSNIRINARCDLDRFKY